MATWNGPANVFLDILIEVSNLNFMWNISKKSLNVLFVEKKDFINTANFIQLKKSYLQLNCMFNEIITQDY